MYKIILFFLLIILSTSVNIYSQKSLIDSLQKVLSKTKPDTNRVEIVTRLSRVYAVGGDMPNAYYYIGWGKKLSDTLHYALGYEKVYHAYGVMYNITGQWDSAIYYQTKEINYFRKKNDKLNLADQLKRISASYANNSDYYNACKALFEAIKTDDAINNIKRLGEDYSNLAGIFADLKLYKLQQQYTRKSLAINTNNELLRATDYANLGDMFNELKQYDSALIYLNSARLIFEKNGHYYELFACDVNMASAFNQLKKYDSAFKYANACLYSPVFSLNKFIQGTTYGMLGEIYLNRNDLPQAKNYIQKAAAIADETHTLLQQFLNYQNLTRVYIKANDSKDAYKSFDAFMGFNDSLLNSTNITTTALSSFIEDKMTSQKSLLTNEVESSEKSKKLWIAFISGIAVLLIAGILIYIKFQRNKTALHLKDLEQKALRAQLNPHFIFNAMQSIQRSYAINTKKGEELLVNFSVLIREVLDKSISSVGTLDEEIELIKKYLTVESQTGASSYNLIINTDAIDASLVAFPSLALQPIIENAVKYGAANSNINLDIKRSNKFLIVVIENDLPDNGVNDVNKRDIPYSGVGLRLTKERINLFNKKHKVNGGVETVKNSIRFITTISLAYVLTEQLNPA